MVNIDGNHPYKGNFNDGRNDLKNSKLVKKEEIYKFPYNEGVFLQPDNPTTERIANHAIKDLEDKLIGENKQPVCFIGYGQSGSGKTSSLIHLSAGGDEIPGVLMQYLKKISNKIKFLEISANNIYTNHNLRGQNSVNSIQKTGKIRPSDEKDYKVDKLGGVIYSEFYMVKIIRVMKMKIVKNQIDGICMTEKIIYFLIKNWDPEFYKCLMKEKSILLQIMQIVQDHMLL